MADRGLMRTIRANLIAGVLTLIPLLVVWIVLDFVFAFLFQVGSPFAGALNRFLAERMPEAVPILNNEFVQWCVAIVVALLLLYTIGAIASRVIGMRLIAAMESLIARIPLVQSVYSASKKLLGILQQKPGGGARVVLIDFPQNGQKTIGLVMQTFTDALSGEELAAVYVPTALNPTAGFLEIVPMASLVQTPLTMDQAMTMIVSGGAVVPEQFSIQRRPAL
jgi:uncharacterized membrane protein